MHGQGSPGGPEVELAHHHHPVALFGPEGQSRELGGPDHGAHGGLPVHQGHPQVALLELGPGHGGVDQETGAKPRSSRLPIAWLKLATL